MTSLIKRESCPGCKSRRRRSLFSCGFLDRPVLDFVQAKFTDQPYAERLAGGRYELMVCEDCQLIYQHEIPDDDFLEVLYDQWLNSDQLDAAVDVGGKVISLARRLAMARELSTMILTVGRPAHEIRVLDFGMGWGQWCSMANALGCQAYGWDLSEQRREHARSIGVRVLEPNDLEAMKFDVINAEQVFEHLVQPGPMLERLRDMLTPGGLIKIGVPDGRHVRRGLDTMDWGRLERDRQFMRHLMPITPLIHINTFTAESLVRLGLVVGMEQVKPQLRTEWSLLPAGSARELLVALARPVYRRFVPSTWILFRRTAHVGLRA